MTIEVAISVLQESLRKSKIIMESPSTFLSGVDIAGGAVIKSGRRIEALETAIAALSAQQTPAKLDRSRWEGCDLCRGINGHVFHCDIVACRFCPNCGHPLTEEAWAELERRMTGTYAAAELHHES